MQREKDEFIGRPAAGAYSEIRVGCVVNIHFSSFLIFFNVLHLKESDMFFVFPVYLLFSPLFTLLFLLLFFKFCGGGHLPLKFWGGGGGAPPPPAPAARGGGGGVIFGPLLKKSSSNSYNAPPPHGL